MQDEVEFAGQLTIDDIKQLAAQGVKTFICNRPDGEEPGQPFAKDLQTTAELLGASFYMIPLATGVAPSQTLLQQYADAYAQSAKPVVAFCRSGRRSSVIHYSAKPLIEQLLSSSKQPGN